jgi:hypothetical protein
MWQTLNGSKDATAKIRRLLDTARNDKSPFVTDDEFQKLLQDYVTKRREFELLREAALTGTGKTMDDKVLEIVEGRLEYFAASPHKNEPIQTDE